MNHSLFSDHMIGARRLRLPGEIEAEIAEWIDRTAMLMVHVAPRHSIDGTTKMGDVMSLLIDPSGKPFGDLVWAEMQTAYDHYSARAVELNAPLTEQIESI
jgi:hypothetical protein